MANFNLTESAVANANNNSNSNNSGTKNNKRKLCHYCQRTFHRNSLLRHQKICVNKSPESRQQLRERRKSYENKYSCFKENDVHSKGCRFGEEQEQDGDPPKLQIFSDGSNTSAECEFAAETLCNNGPPTLQSVDGEKSEVEIRVTRLMKLNSRGNGNSRITRATSSSGDDEHSSKLGVEENIRTGEQSLGGVAAKIISNASNPDSAIQGSQSESKGRKAEGGKSKCSRRSSSGQPGKRRMPGGKSTSQCKKQKQDPGTISSGAAKASSVVVLDPAVELKCQKCLRTFESKESLQSHGREYIQSGALVCLLCSNKEVESLEVHFKEEHQTEKKRVGCELCSSTIDRNYHFYHFKEHHSLAKKFKCNLCSKEFSFMQNLLLHKSNEHLKEMYNSKYCQRNGDMMNVRDSGGNGDKEKNSVESSGKNRYVRRYGAPPRNSSSETKCNGNGINGNVACKLNGASVASLTTVSEKCENGLNGGGGSDRRSSTESSGSEVPPNSSGVVPNGGVVSKGSSTENSCDSFVNKSDVSPENPNAKNTKTVDNTISKTVENTTALAVDSSCHPAKSDPEIAIPAEPQQDVYKEYTCRLCPVKFESRFKYLRHLKNVHHWTRDQILDPEYQPEFWCPECGQEFVVRPTLMKHLIIAHEDLTDVEDYMERVGYGSRPLLQFQCSVCLIVFESEQELSFHLRCHGLAYLQYLTSNSRFS